MKLNLVVETPGSALGKRIPITRTPFLIGRDPKCHLRPSSAMVSGNHCVILVRQGKIYVNDTSSTNGTFVNEIRVAQETRLQNGDLLRIGPLVFAVSIELTTPVDQPTPLPPSRAKTEVVDDEAVAAVLLATQDEDLPRPGSATIDASAVPTGSTEVISPKPEAASGDPAQAEPAKPDKAQAAKAAVVSTSVAAEELLNKYLRRPRKS